MQNFIYYVLIFLFLIINYLIIKGDIRHKKIYNKYLKSLIYLSIFFYIYLVLFIGKIDLIYIFLQITVSLVVCFLLYYFSIWRAGDSKYLLVLYLFLPSSSIVIFVGNIALVTIVYLLLFYLNFYVIKCIFDFKYAKSLYQSIFLDLNGKFKNFLTDKKHGKYNNPLYLILKWFVFFLIIFVLIRLFRLYIFQHLIYQSGDSSGFWGYLFKVSLEYNIYFFILLILIYGSLYGFYKLFHFIKEKISDIFNKKGTGENKLLIDIILLAILMAILIIFIIYDYNLNKYELYTNLKRIFTFYILLYITIKILWYSYKITFQIGEEDYISIKKLKSGMIVDKNYLINLFGTQTILGAPGEQQNKNGILYPNPKKGINEIFNPIGKNDLNLIKKIYSTVNIYHKKNSTKNFTEVDSIKIIKTFSFGIYIFLGFLITYLYNDYLYRFIIEYIFKYLQIKN